MAASCLCSTCRCTSCRHKPVICQPTQQHTMTCVAANTGSVLDCRLLNMKEVSGQTIFWQTCSLCLTWFMPARNVLHATANPHVEGRHVFCKGLDSKAAAAMRHGSTMPGCWTHTSHVPPSHVLIMHHALGPKQLLAPKFLLEKVILDDGLH